MAKVFRFHEGTALKDWQNSSPLNETNINAIEDPDGATAKKQITSIPSPFARIDLVRTAFKTICNSKDLDGKTIFHKMVSDAFDVGQLFFDYEKHAEKISIIAWDKNTDLDILLNSSNTSHKILGETIRLYLEQDADIYNFNDLKRFFLINYKNGPKPLNIIGGTSPASLFFTTANNLDYTNLQSGNDKFFDSEFCPLYKREPEFIKFIYALKNQISDFNSKFPYVSEYLELTYSKLEFSFREQLNPENLNTWYNNLSVLSINDSQNFVEIIGYPIKMKANSSDLIQETSDFCIEPTTDNFSGQKPLVLPNDIFAEKLIYTTDNWDLNYKAPFINNLPLNERRLPHTNEKYPYLTISDFLEPVLIRTILPINSKFFFDGNIDQSENGFLLPIKPLFFDYFNVDDLQGSHRDGAKFFELKVLANKSIECILRIPVRNNKYIVLKRTYNNPININSVPEFNEEKNKGAIIENLFTVGLFPFLKFSDNIFPDYRISIYDGDYLSINKQNKYSLKFYDQNNDILNNTPSKSKRSKSDGSLISNQTFIVNSNFEFIQVENNYAKGLLIPLFKEKSGVDQFSFAIDFGTSNTHIEYKNSESINSIPKPFEIQANEIQFAKSHFFEDTTLFDNYLPLRLTLDFMNQDFIPQILGVGSEYSFPIRTSVLYEKNLNFDFPIYSFADINIPFTYEKIAFDHKLKSKTNLKWEVNSLENDKIINSYFEKIIFLIRTKILLNNGKVDKTKIIWFYPSSMSIHQQNLLEEKWNFNINKYLGLNAQIIKVCESLAPFYYYTNLGKLDPALVKPIVSIDMGGGTTDVVIFKDNKAQSLTSFKFAGNSIFGDDYRGNPENNGFVNKYFDRYINLLKDNNCTEEREALLQIREFGSSVDIINSLFSLQTNKKLFKKGIELNFLDELKRDNDFKIIFLLYFSSVTYHIAKLMNLQGTSSPSVISFSGTASKLISILDSSASLATISKFINLIFSKFDKNASIKIVFPENPKELTCKGGLFIDAANNIEPDEIKIISSTKATYNEKSKFFYRDLDESYIQEVILEFKDFISQFFELNEEFSFNKNFGINNEVLSFSQEFILENFEIELRTGLFEKETEIGKTFKDEKVTETLFFYPLIGTLGKLASEIKNNFNEYDI
jgi:hypothetical protein